MPVSPAVVTLRRARLAAVAGAALALLAPASASAALSTFGSELALPASIEHAHQADTAYWSTSLSGGASATVPFDGQIRAVRIKGMAIKREDARPAGSVGGETMFHVQALAGSTFRITSQALYMPNTGDPQQVNSFPLENFCVKAGERIAFNTVGGFDGVGDQVNGPYPLSPYPMGTPLRIFASAPSASTPFYEQANGTDNGESMASDGSGPREADQGPVKRGVLDGQELLMQMTIATGDDRSYECGGPNTYRPADPAPKPRPGGGGAPPGVQKTTLPRRQRVNVSRKGVAGMALFCQPGSGRCGGRVTIYARVGGKRVAIGSKRFSIGAKSTGKAKVKLSKRGFRLYKQRRRALPVTITAVTAPGTAAHRDSLRVTLRKVGSR